MADDEEVVIRRSDRSIPRTPNYVSGGIVPPSGIDIGQINIGEIKIGKPLQVPRSGDFIYALMVHNEQDTDSSADDGYGQPFAVTFTWEEAVTALEIRRDKAVAEGHKVETESGVDSFTVKYKVASNSILGSFMITMWIRKTRLIINPTKETI